MKLPPSIEIAARELSFTNQPRSIYERALAIAHEACRLQREADDREHCFHLNTPLVVPEPQP